MVHIIKHQVKVKAQKRCNGGGASNTEDIDVLRAENCVHRPLECSLVHFLQGGADLLNVALEHHGEDLLIAKAVVGYLDPLNGSQLVPDHLLQGLLHGGIAVVAQLHRKTNHRGFADIDGFAQLAGGHKRRLVVGIHNIVCNELLTLGKMNHAVLDQCQNIAVHVDTPPSAAQPCAASLSRLWYYTLRNFASSFLQEFNNFMHFNLLERRNLIFCQISPLSHRKRAQFQTSLLHSFEPGDGHTALGRHFPNLAVPSLVNGDL